MSDDPVGMDAESKDELAADLALDAAKEYQAREAEQHDLFDAVAEEEGAPLLETRATIAGVTIPVSGRLNGAFIERVERLDAEAKRRANDEDAPDGVSDIVRELGEIIDDLVDDDEITARGVFQTYRAEGVAPVRRILEEVMDALRKEDERLRGDADGFRKE
ncbi:tail assembly chaperone [Halorubrum tailed virus 29]|uniref:Tail assembly chaperone n=1 Tax=Halorubrum tailed virus 29 TaxID=2878010 RepID=A0AAE8XZ01_9CAUD|nr:tail assembly chaperone [Halorubrum tailed virus 29]UBF23342.1 tail assembly chaperone [Halorubrum tailed virus 29]